MKHTQTPQVPGGQVKALSLMAALFAGSIALSMTVVSFVVKWLSQA